MVTSMLARLVVSPRLMMDLVVPLEVISLFLSTPVGAPGFDAPKALLFFAVVSSYAYIPQEIGGHGCVRDNDPGMKGNAVMKVVTSDAVDVMSRMVTQQ